MFRVDRWSAWPIEVELYAGDEPPAGEWQLIGWTCGPMRMYIGLKITVRIWFIRRTFYWLWELRRC